MAACNACHVMPSVVHTGGTHSLCVLCSKPGVCETCSTVRPVSVGSCPTCDALLPPGDVLRAYMAARAVPLDSAGGSYGVTHGAGVVLKTLNQHDNTSTKKRGNPSMYMEGYIAMLMSQRNIGAHVISVTDTAGTSPIMVGITMERAEQTLSSAIRNNAMTRGGKSVGGWAVQALEVLREMHAMGFVHNDAKTKNFVVVQTVEDPSMYECKAIDFGQCGRREPFVKLEYYLQDGSPENVLHAYDKNELERILLDALNEILPPTKQTVAAAAGEFDVRALALSVIDMVVPIATTEVVTPAHTRGTTVMETMREIMTHAPPGTNLMSSRFYEYVLGISSPLDAMQGVQGVRPGSIMESTTEFVAWLRWMAVRYGIPSRSLARTALPFFRKNLPIHVAHWEHLKTSMGGEIASMCEKVETATGGGPEKFDILSLWYTSMHDVMTTLPRPPDTNTIGGGAAALKALGKDLTNMATKFLFHLDGKQPRVAEPDDDEV